eukprot:1839109-Alexandrium_andersonii.AAC.1
MKTKKPKAQAQQRANNVASVADIAKLLKELNPARDELRLQVATTASYDEFLDRHGEFVSKLLRITTRPTASTVRKAVVEVFEFISHGAATGFADMIARSVSHARSIARNATTGAKIPPATLRIVKCFRTMKRVLKKRLSASSGPDVDVVEPEPATPPDVISLS